MATGRSMQLTKQFGEYLAAAELCRRGLIATTFSGNVPEFDILAISDKRKTISLQIKTSRSHSWQFDAKIFMNINIKNKLQQIGRKTKLPNPKLICILVRLAKQGKDEFYIIKTKELQNIIYKSYPAWLKSIKFKRPKNPESTRCSVSISDLLGYKDNWELIV